MKTVYAMMTVLALMFAIVGMSINVAHARSGGSGGGSPTKVDTIKVTKCFYDVPTGQMLIKASSSDPSARLSAYLPSGKYQGEVQNGGGSKYGGTVMGYIANDPQFVTILSSSSGSITVPTTPFQL